MAGKSYTRVKKTGSAPRAPSLADQRDLKRRERVAEQTGVTRQNAKKAKSHAYRELALLSQEQGVVLQGATCKTTGDLLNEVLNRAVMHMEFAASKVDQLKEDEVFEGNSHTLNRWYTLEKAAREEVFRMAEVMVKLGLRERELNVLEAHVALAINIMMKSALEVGITKEQREAWAEETRRRMEAVEVDNVVARIAGNPSGKSMRRMEKEGGRRVKEA